MKKQTIKAWAMNCYYDGWCIFASRRAAKCFQERWTPEPQIVRVTVTIKPITKPKKGGRKK